MPRAIWNGAISFGLVNIPVKLYGAVSPKTVGFHQLDAETHARVKQKRVSSDDGSEVPWERIVKGYEVSPGNYVVLTDDELAELDPVAQHTIDIEQFVDLDEIDPMFFDKAYYLAPVNAPKPYALLRQALADADKVGIARFVLRTKQYLGAIRAQGDHLVLSTMVYADEINDPSTIADLDGVGDIDVSERELSMAASLIDSLSGPFDPASFTDTYRESVLALIGAKAEGAVPASAAPQGRQAEVVDLMAALEASVAEAEAARKRHPTAKKASAAKKAAAPKSGTRGKARAKPSGAATKRSA
jgi:DNA end-binding protein Ku